MTHTARCDDVPFRHPTVATIALPAGRQRLFPSDTAETSEQWAWNLIDDLVYVSAPGPAKVELQTDGRWVVVWVDVGTVALDLPRGVLFRAVRVTVGEAGQQVALWTK